MCVCVCVDLPLALRTHCERGRLHISSLVMMSKEFRRLETHFFSFILTYAYEWLDCLGICRLARLRYTDTDIFVFAKAVALMYAPRTPSPSISGHYVCFWERENLLFVTVTSWQTEHGM